jgi:hypothetical protein
LDIPFRIFTYQKYIPLEHFLSSIKNAMKKKVSMEIIDPAGG